MIVSGPVGVWYSVEVIDGSSSAASWADAWGDSLVASALTHGVYDFAWHEHSWGIVFEVCFEDEVAWERFRQSAAVTAALDAVPDPISGLIVYRGRGGSAGSAVPRKPRPLAGSGSAALPVPWDLGLDWPSTFDDLAGPAFRKPVLVGLGL